MHLKSTGNVLSIEFERFLSFLSFFLLLIKAIDNDDELRVKDMCLSLHQRDRLHLDDERNHCRQY